MHPPGECAKRPLSCKGYTYTRPVHAERLLHQALENSASDPAYHFFFKAEEAGYFRKDDRTRERLLLEGLKVSPDDPFLLRNLGIGYLIDKRLNKARRYLEAALKADPRDADTLRCLGLLASMKWKESKAVNLYRQALKIDPEDYDAMRQVCSSLASGL